MSDPGPDPVKGAIFIGEVTSDYWLTVGSSPEYLWLPLFWK
jgi:hypothetical protein